MLPAHELARLCDRLGYRVRPERLSKPFALR
jgi:hypothetical protein